METVADELVRLAQEANDAYERAQDLYRRGTEHAISAGTALIKAKARIDHGRWTRWLSDHFRGSERTAQIYMRVARHAKQFDDETRAEFGQMALREAAETLAAPAQIRVNMIEATPLRQQPCLVVVREQTTELPTRTLLGMKSVAAVLPERHPSKMIAAPVEDAPIADSYAITHLTALLRYSRASRPADLAAALAPTRSVDPVDVERLVAWASMLVTELKQRL